MSKKTEIEVAGKKLTVSNLDKVLYPAAGFTKGQVIDYYIRIAPVLLPHLKNRRCVVESIVKISQPPSPPIGISRRNLYGVPAAEPA